MDTCLPLQELSIRVNDEYVTVLLTSVHDNYISCLSISSSHCWLVQRVILGLSNSFSGQLCVASLESSRLSTTHLNSHWYTLPVSQALVLQSPSFLHDSPTSFMPNACPAEVVPENSAVIGAPSLTLPEE